MDIETSFLKLKSYIEKENFKGYDPYDTLNSWFPFKLFGKWPAVIATQIQKRNPLNIRPLIGIKKEINPKAFGLFLLAYSMLYRRTGEEAYLKKADFFYSYLKTNYCKGYSGYAWGYNFPWASPVKFMDAYIPSAVVTGFVCRGLWQYYQVTGKQEVADILLSSSDFIMNDLSVYSDESGKCISYTSIMQDICYNSSLLATEVLAYKFQLTKDPELKDHCIELVNFVVFRQKPDGMWAYSEDKDTGIERNQIDFHQGFVLESLHDIRHLLDVDIPAWDLAIKKGLDFYKNRQFTDSGRSFYRLPKEFPVDIHFQSQGIIVFSKLQTFDLNNIEFSRIILQWTIENMLDQKGYFYYRKFKYFTDKTSYMRWSQAWMFLAFVIFYHSNEVKN